MTFLLAIPSATSGVLTFLVCSPPSWHFAWSRGGPLSHHPPPPPLFFALAAAPQNVKLLSPLYTVCDPFLNFFRGTLGRGHPRDRRTPRFGQLRPPPRSRVGDRPHGQPPGGTE